MSLEAGAALFNEGRFWEAHEAWEGVWIQDRQGPDAAFWKGLIQIAAGCLHARRHNRRGAMNKWRSGLQYLEAYRPHHLGAELDPLVAAISQRLSRLEASPGTWPALGPEPRLRYRLSNPQE